MNPPKICFLIPSVSSGGIEMYLLRFLTYVEDTKNITVLVRSNEKGELYEEYKATSVTLKFLPLGYISPAKIWQHYKFYKAQNFDVICDFNANFAGIPMLLAKLVRVKKRITFYRQSSHHFEKTRFRLAYTNFLNKLVKRYSTNIFSNSKSALKFFFPKEYQNDDRFKVIKNGVDIHSFSEKNLSKEKLREKLNLPKEKFIIGHTGRFAEAKNHYFLIDVVTQLIYKDNNNHLVLIGNNTDKLLPYINSLNIGDNVTVLGYKSNISEYLHSFNLYFFPSITEGQPNALIEAMISGLPIVTSQIDSIKECLPKEGVKSLIDPYNVNDTVKKILKIKSNPENYIYRDFAIENFDAKIQFEEFRKNLLN